MIIGAGAFPDKAHMAFVYRALGPPSLGMHCWVSGRPSHHVAAPSTSTDEAQEVRAKRVPPRVATPALLKPPSPLLTKPPPSVVPPPPQVRHTEPPAAGPAPPLARKPSITSPPVLVGEVVALPAAGSSLGGSQTVWCELSDPSVAVAEYSHTQQACNDAKNR